MINLKNVLTLIALVLLSQVALANNQKKASGLKDAKVAKAERPHVTSIHGGIILTKVTLESRTSLEPYAKEDDVDYAQRCESLVGLVVFHIADKKDNTSLPSAMYVWDGEKWQQASFEYRRVRVEGLGEQQK